MKLKKRMASFMLLTGIVSLLATGCGGAGDDKAQSATDWDSSNQISIMSREDGSGTRGAFVELFGIEEKKGDKKEDMTTQDAEITNSTSVMMTSVAGDEYAIGYISLGSLNDKVKALKIDGAEANEKNVKDGTYKISRNFNIAVKKGKENKLSEDFINYILSSEGQKVVLENKFIPLDSTNTFTSTKPSGKITVGGSSSVSPVMEKLIEGYKKLNPDATIELQTTDSTTGMISTIDGGYDIGMASRELKDSELSGGLEPKVIAIDGIAVIVNKANTTDELTTEQVKNIYTGQVASWEEVSK